MDASLWTAEETIAALKTESRVRRIRTRNLRIAVSIILLITMAGAILTISSGRSFDWITLVPLFSISAGISMGVGSRHRRLSAAAANLNDPRVVGSLIEVLDSGDQSLVATAQSALTRLLREVDSADGLQDHQLEKLAFALSKSRNRAFFSAGVDLVARLGTARCLYALDAMVAIPPSGLKNRSLAENIARQGAADLRLRLSRLQMQSHCPEQERTVHDSGVR